VTTQRILVLNAGSSSLKYQVIQTGTREEPVLAKGSIERIGAEGGMAPTHMAAVELALSRIETIDGVGHRVVHGGPYLHQSVLLDAEVERLIGEACTLAPLHNPPALACMHATARLLPGLPQAVVFDTAFFHPLPRKAYLYGIPYEYCEHDHIRRYGFHGTSHRYVSAKACDALGIPPDQAKLITCHLGNGCSVCAIDGGRAVDISMGLTPLEGVMMGTRSGDLDPSILFHLARTRNMTLAEMEELLNKRGGLLGLSGRSNDMRDLCQAAAAGCDRSRMAVEVFCYRVKKYIGAYWAVLGGADAIVFTGGIGENRPEVRAEICQGLEGLAAEILVIPTNEELLIARDTARLITGTAAAR